MEYRFFTYIFVKGKHKTRRDVSGLKLKKKQNKTKTQANTASHSPELCVGMKWM